MCRIERSLVLDTPNATSKAAGKPRLPHLKLRDNHRNGLTGAADETPIDSMLNYLMRAWHARPSLADIRARLVRAAAARHLPPQDRPALRSLDPFADWCAQDRLTRTGRADLAVTLTQNAIALPRMSVLLPIYRPDRGLLEAAITSVRQQIYTDWELCLCDDGNNDPWLLQYLAELSQADARIRHVSLARNGGISRATNAAASLATGEVLLFLDQDDEITLDCLAEFAIAFAEAPSTDLAYSDHDKIDAEGKRSEPCFKPGWSPVLLLSYMYLGHALAVRRALFEQLAGFRSAFDGSQDFDFALRATEHSRSVHHIPRILYHWRALPGSTAISAAEKPGSIDAGANAVRAALDRRGIAAEVNRADWARRAQIGLFTPSFPPFLRPLDVLIFEEGGRAIADGWLRSLASQLPDTARILCLDPVDGDSMADRRVVELPGEATLGAKLNRAMAETAGGMVLVLKAGTTLPGADWLDQLCGYAGLAAVGIVGPRHLHRTGKVLNAGYVLPPASDRMEAAFAGLAATRPGSQYLARTAHECTAISAACALLSPGLAGQIGQIDDMLDDSGAVGAALSHRARMLGGSVLCCADIDAWHDATLPGPREHAPDARDPWYNRNLSQGQRQFTPARRTASLHRHRAVRVAALTHNLDREGAQTTLFDALTGLKAAGLATPFLISPRDGVMRADFEEAGIPVSLVEAPRRRASRRQLETYRAMLADAYRHGQAETVLANTLESYAGILAATDAGLPAIWWQHEGGAWHEYYRHLRPPAYAQALLAFGQAYRVVQVARATMEQWRPIATRDNFEVIRPAPPAEQIGKALARWDRKEARAALGLHLDECCILLLGSVSRRKRQADVVEALQHLPATSLANLRVFIAGSLVEPDYAKRLEAAIASLPAEKRNRIQLVGHVTDTALYYAAADVFVSCSRQESAPRSITEAMAFGLPILATPVDGVPEIVKFGVNALSFAVGDTRLLSELLLQLSTSRGERRRLGEASLALHRKAPSCDAMVSRFGALLHEAARLNDVSSISFS